MKTIKNLFYKNKKNILKCIFIFIVLTLIISTALDEFKKIDFVEISNLLREFPLLQVFKFMTLGLLAVSTMTIYDFLIAEYLQVDIKKGSLFSISFLANSINNFSGLGGLTGVTIRSLIFKNTLDDKEDILNYNFLLLPATGIGLSVMTILSLLNRQFIYGFLDQFKWLYVGIILFSLFLLAYFHLEKIISFISKKTIIELDRAGQLLRVKLLFSSLFEWLIAFLLFYSLTRYVDGSNSIFNIFTVFTLASTAGILSLLPGGVGSFDLVILLGLELTGITKENIMTILILYRLFYYILPLILSTVITLIIQTQGHSKLIQFNKTKGFIKKTSKITNLLLSLLILFSGVTLLIDGLFPYVPENMGTFSKLLSPLTLELSHHISIAIGILLIVISKQIRMKVKRSYYISIGLIAIGIISSLIKGFSYIHILYLIGVLTILYMSKNSFYRESTPLNLLALITKLVLGFLAIFIYMKMSNIVFESFIKLDQINFKLLTHFQFKNLFKSSILTYLILFLVIIYYSFTKKKISDDHRYESLDRERLNLFLEKYKGNILTHLIYLEDKHLFWSGEDEFLIQFEVGYNKVVVLGDPMGNPAYMEKGLAEFLRFIDSYGYKSIFYQVSEDNLSFYHDNGYYIFKLGEAGLVNLEDFDLTGSKSRDFRNTLKRFEKDRFSFELYKPNSISQELFLELKEVSDDWLGERDEMSFSLGSFSKEYLETCDLAIVRNIESREIIAFSTMIPAYDGETFSMDLMRLRSRTPNNTMNFLILKLLLHYKELGYRYFNLGMAPLSNVGTAKKAHLQEKVAHLVFEYGNYFYSFQGLRNFKNKFKPEWEGKYLIYEDITSLPQSLLEVTMLIHK